MKKKFTFHNRFLKIIDNIPIVFSLIVLVLSFSITLNSLNNESDSLIQENKIAIADFTDNLKNSVVREISLINLLLIDWIDVKNSSQLNEYHRFLKIVPIFFNISIDVIAINWINNSGVINWVYPFERNLNALNKSVIYLADGLFNHGFEYAISTNQTGFTHLIPFFQGGIGFASYTPIIYNNSIFGYFNVVFELKNIFHNIINSNHGFNKFSFIVSQNKTFLPSTNENFTLSDSFVVSKNISIFTMHWQVFSHPIETEIYKTNLISVLPAMLIELTFCVIIYLITTLLKRRNDFIKKQFEEREKIMDNLIQDKKFKALGKLTGGIAHDFNSYLSVMNNTLQLIDLELENENIKFFSTETRKEFENYLRSINNNVDKSKKLVDQVLTFSRNRELNFQILNLEETIQDAVLLINQKHNTQINFTFDFNIDQYIYGEEILLEQIFINILSNSVNAINLEREPKINIFCYKDTEEYNKYMLENLINIDPEIEFMKYGCIIKIKDNGNGMSQEQVKIAFDPYTSLKSTGKGSGLGLGIVHNNISILGGVVSINSKLGEFTEVIIKLPLVVKKVKI